MNDRTQRILIVTVGVVLLGGGKLVYDYLNGRPFADRTCPDGRTVREARPQAFVIKYSGTDVEATLGRKELTVDLKVDEKVLQVATERTQALDQLLRMAIIEQVAKACEPAGAEILTRLDRYLYVDLVKLRQSAEKLDRLADTKDVANKPKAESTLGAVAAGAAEAGKTLSPAGG